MHPYISHPGGGTSARSDFDVHPERPHRSEADGLLNFATAPLYGIVPYCCEAFLPPGAGRVHDADLDPALAEVFNSATRKCLEMPSGWHRSTERGVERRKAAGLGLSYESMIFGTRIPRGMTSWSKEQTSTDEDSRFLRWQDRRGAKGTRMMMSDG